MKRSDTMRIMAIIKQVYPRYYAEQTREDLEVAVNLWTDLFAEDDGKLVYAAVKAFIASDTKGFPPSIGQIREKLVKLQNPDALSENEAWALVLKAIRNSAYHAAEEYAKLPPDIQRVVHHPSMLKSWAMTADDEVQTVVASNFMRSYRARMKTAQEYLAMPPGIREMLHASDTTHALPEQTDPEERKRQAMLMLAESREVQQREILGEEYDKLAVRN